MKIVRHILFVFYILYSPAVLAQDTRTLTFDESLQIALSSSFTFKELETNFRADYFNLRSEEAGFKSNANMEFSLPQFSESIAEQFNTDKAAFEFVSSKVMRLMSRLTINQPISRTGGNFSFNANLTYFDQFSDQEPNYFGRLFFEFRQPILQPNEQKNDIERAKINLERTRLNYASRKSGSISRLTRTYYDLFRFQKQITLKESLYDELQNAYNQAQTRNQAGQLDDTELLQLEVDKNNLESTLVKLRSDRLNREENFKQQIGLESPNAIRVEDSEDFVTIDVELERAIQLGMANRPEVRRFELDLRRRDIIIEDIKSQGRLTGDIITTFGFDNSKEAFNNIFQDFNRSRSIVLRLSLPILDWGRNEARLEEQYIWKEKILNSQQNQSSQINREISDAFYDLQETINRLNILESSQTNAERSYRLTLDQFNNNQVKVQDLRLARERYTDTIDRYLNAFVDYKQAVVELNRNTMWDFQNNRSFVTQEEIDALLKRANNSDNN